MDIIQLEGPNDTKGIRQFSEVANSVYKEDSIWVPQCEKAFIERYKGEFKQNRYRMWPILAFQKNIPVARGVAILDNKAVNDSGQREGWIGFFEALEEHQDAAKQVLQRCEKILWMEGARSILAPKVDSLLVGLQTGGFDLPQTLLTNHNPPYYMGIFQGCGYDEYCKMHTYYFTRESAIKLEISLPGFQTRELDRSRLMQEITIFNKLQSSIFGQRNSYIPRTLEEDQQMIQSFIDFLDDELVIIAEDSESTPVGLLICLPDVYQFYQGQRLDRARILSIGAIPRLQKKGIGVVMCSHLLRNLLRKGYQTAEASWILDSNILPNNLVKRFNASPGREFTLMRKRRLSIAAL
jgi:GNAT superfamily N-acetyltransferase